jgi:5'(3')-deoxyribonucleotidase
MKNIGLDMDGVIVNFIEPILKMLEVHVNDITDYKLDKLFPKRKEEIQNMYGKKGYFSSLKPYPKAIDFMNKLKKIDGVKLWFISKPAKTFPDTWSDKVIWIGNYLPFMLNTTILCGDKSLVKMDILIDDDPNNLITNNSKDKILMDQPWNRKDKLFTRVKDYDELYDEIARLIKEK